MGSYGEDNKRLPLGNKISTAPAQDYDRYIQKQRLAITNIDNKDKSE